MLFFGEGASIVCFFICFTRTCERNAHCLSAISSELVDIVQAREKVEIPQFRFVSAALDVAAFAVSCTELCGGVRGAKQT